jgi:hypothetical protein
MNQSHRSENRMIDSSIIKNEIDKLENIAVDIEKDMKFLVDESKVNPSPTNYYGNTYSYYFLQISGEVWTRQREALKKYENWFSMSLIFIKDYIPEKESAFSKLYKCNGPELGVKELIQLRKQKELRYSNGDSINHERFKDNVYREFISKFDEQRHFLLTIPGIVSIKELSIRGIIYNTFIDREIDEAVYLYEKGHYRAAGAIAGVALEQHLRHLCEKYNLDYGHKDTIEPLVQKLYKNDKMDGSEMKKIQYLATIRDKCDHPSEVTASEVKELIEKLKKILNA